ncbi:hypothetical protein [Geminocystis sp. GBBB08]|nr:hypothetical protein [Geminocystis sp. GBBB08]
MPIKSSIKLPTAPTGKESSSAMEVKIQLGVKTDESWQGLLVKLNF